MQLEYFFDCSSPWTYLSFVRVQALCEVTGTDLVWKPFLVGGVFNAVNPSVYAARDKPLEVKARYAQKDLKDWADYCGIAIGSPPVFPVNSVKVMRGCFVALEHGLINEFAKAAFRAYWTDLRDISQEGVIRDLVLSVGLPVDEFFEKIAADEYKQKLRDNTDELIARGGFGSPTMFVDGDDMYFGNDRFELIQHRLTLGK